MNGSVAITDVPVSPLSTMGGFQPCTYTVAVFCLCFHLCSDAVHCCLHDRGGVLAVHEDAVSGCGEFGFVHVLIIGDGGALSIQGGTDR